MTFRFLRSTYLSIACTALLLIPGLRAKALRPLADSPDSRGAPAIHPNIAGLRGTTALALFPVRPIQGSPAIHPSAIASAQSAEQLPRFDGARALEYTGEFVATGPRWVGSPGHAKAEAFLSRHFAKDDLEKDTFTAATPAGVKEMTNYIVKFPGDKDGIIVVASHYDTNYPLKDTSYVGANDGGSSTGLLLELASSLRGKKLAGASVWLVFFDGEEAFKDWTDTDSDYGSRHLAAKWQKDGTLKRIKGFLLADMIGDSDLEVERDLSSTPWLVDLVGQAAAKYGDQSYFLGRAMPVGDDTTPFLKLSVPSADIIDFNYGYQNSFWHTPQDTMDKLSAKSLTIIGDTLLETLQLLNQR